MDDRADFLPSPSIGVFDSGVGGLSVLRALRQRLPHAAITYVGDVAHAPYGGRTAEDILERSTRICQWLIDNGATVIVVACNTATVMAIKALRTRWPGRVFIGVEPGVKPAAARSASRRIAVMTTPATAGSERLQELIAHHAGGAHIHVQACEDLAATIERGVFDGPELLRVLEPICEAIRAARVDTVVLGCTHYPFVERVIGRLLGSNVQLLDTAQAVAERTASLWPGVEEAARGRPGVRVLSTGRTATMQALLSTCLGLEEARVQKLVV